MGSLRALPGLLFCATLAAQPASIAGVVLNHATGQPLAGVHLRFLTGDFGGGGLDQVYGAISDRAGHFSIANLKPGLFVLIAERTGFVRLPPAHPTMPFGFFPLKPGQQLIDYNIDMTPCASISGRVVDDHGDPVQNISVQGEPISKSTPMDSMFGQGNGSTTNDLGEFHLVTAPGRYRLHATHYGFDRGLPPEIRTDGTSAAPFAETYYPSAGGPGGASIVELAAGQDVAGLEIRLLRGAAASGHALTISGLVSGAPDNRKVILVLRHGESAAQLYNSNQAVAVSDGKFAFSGLQPGFYRIFAQYSAGKIFLLSQTVDLTLGSSDETTLQLVLAPAGEITGTLEIVSPETAGPETAGTPTGGDAAPGAPGTRLTVRLGSLESDFSDGNTGSPQGEVGRNGAFHVANVSPGRFRPVVEPLPENAYIQSVTLDGAPAVNNILDLSRGVKGSHVKIIVNRGGAQVSGTVLDDEGKPVASPLVMIFLVTDPKQLRQMEEGDMNRAAGGKYSIQGVRPGKYRLFAVDALSLFATAGDAEPDQDEIMKALWDSGEEIEIKPGGRIVKDLKVIDKDDKATGKLPAKEPPHAAQKQ